MPVFAVTYVYAPDSAARRDVVRPEHRDFLRGLHEQGRVRLSGPLPATGDQPDGALILVEADDADGALALLDADPFRREGLVGTRTAREFVPVIGSLAG
ncbi:YciI family protein [Puerhibacterium puerhi]|uniref:YciI family protein n=1 Tax=Puerhibacterium puerhi TaxID=2692623 RepID=UPI001357939A|nr:YciI family protein [Puerhibacterium puerhi]